MNTLLLSCRRMFCRCLTSVTALLLLSVQISSAGSASWLSSPPTSSWTNAANWTAGGPPDGAGDVATFATSSKTAISQSANIQVSGITFSAGGNAFSITTAASFIFTISGAGITNNSGVTQNFHATAAVNSAAISFINGATAGNLTAFTNGGNPNPGFEGAVTSFANTSSAGSGVFTNNPGTSAQAGGGGMQFFDSSSAGNSTITNKSSVVTDAFGGMTDFYGSSTAGTSNITNEGHVGSVVHFPWGGFTRFFANSTLGQATVTNKAASATEQDAFFAGTTQFFQTSSAGDGTVINNGSPDDSLAGLTEFHDNSKAGNATFTNNAGTDDGVANPSSNGGSVRFLNNSTANTATFTNNGAAQNDTESGEVVFRDNSTAASGMFINNGATDPEAFPGGATIFVGMSTAANATVIANTGVDQFRGGRIAFDDTATGGTAVYKIFGNGMLEIDLHDAPGVTVGSLEGDGRVFLGANQLTVGNNNASTTFSGSINNGAFNGSGANTMGSLKKIGTGTFSLTSANTYSGGTFVNAGTLQASHDGALGGGNVNTLSGTTLILQSGATNNYISDVASLSIVTGSSVNLNFTGTPDVVGFLIVNGVSQAAGLWGSAASGAPNQLPQFTGVGKILVTTPAARSRKMQGAGNFNITLPFTGPAGIECRSAGPGNAYQIILTFGLPVTFSGASVTSGTGTVGSTSGNGTNTVTLNLTGVTNIQRLVVTLFGVNYGAATGNVPIRMNVLVGDTNANGAVNSSDVSQTKSQSGLGLTNSNFREDVTNNGSINSSDISLVKSKSGTALPP